MPRTRRTATGAPAAPIEAPSGATYGEGTALAALQRAAPAPQQAGPPAAAPPAGAPPAPAGGLPALPKPGLLTAPTTRPNEPGTHGLVSGPGAGPEILAQAPGETPSSRFLREIAQATGRTEFIELARRFGL